jgi:hypothetical protein
LLLTKEGDGVQEDDVPFEDDSSEGTGPDSIGPGPSSQAPDTTEPQAGVETKAPFSDADVRADFGTVLEIGRLEETFEWGGHSFTIRTLSIGVVMELGLMTKQYQGTTSDLRAFTTAIVAAALTHVNGEPLVVPIESNVRYADVRARFRYLQENWYPPIIDVLYDRYMRLEGRANEVVNRLLAPSGQTTTKE